MQYPARKFYFSDVYGSGKLTQSFNGKSQPRTNTDPTGGKVEQVYDEAGRLVGIWDQNGHPVERYAYDTRGNLISKTDADNRSETYQYDDANRLIQTVTRKGEVISYAYDEVQDTRSC